MEEFLHLNWSWNTTSVSSVSTQEFEAKFFEDEKDIFLCHLNEIDHIHLLDSYGKDNFTSEEIHRYIDPRSGKEITKQLIDHSKHAKIRLFQDFPQRSSMDSIQHRSCLNAISKLKFDQGDISMGDRDDIRTYAQLFNQRNKEKIEFLEFVKAEFFKRNIKNCYNLEPQLEKFITKRWKNSIQNVKKSNNNFYRLQSALPLNNNDRGDEISIEFEKTVVEAGVVLAINRKKYSNPLQMSCSFLDSFFAKDAHATTPSDQFLLHDKVDVAIKLTTLSSILSYAKDLSIEWNLTFSLKECNNDKVIVFDEILPPTVFGCLDKNREAYKYGLTAAIVVPKKREMFSFKDNCFVNTQHEQQISDEPPSSILAVDPAQKYQIWQFEEYLKKSNVSKPTNGLISHSNHRQQLWKMKRSNGDYCRLLICSSQDVCEKEADGTVRFINLSPKLDYQCEFGAEQMSFPELISEWCQLRFGPNTVTDRVRIDPVTSCILEVNQVNIDDVEFDLNRLYHVKKEMLLSPLFNIIEIIKQFPPNEYMLRHQSKNGEQAMIYLKCNDGSSPNIITISNIYESQQLDTSNLAIVPWNPIDDKICTAVHRQSSVMPCAFPHWGKHQKVTQNDRLRLVERAKQKIQQKTDAETERMSIFKKKKKLIKRKVRNEKEKKRKCQKLMFEGESLNPNELFDEQGNIQMTNCINNKLTKDAEENDSFKPICYESYLKDAAVNLSDLEDCLLIDC